MTATVMPQGKQRYSKPDGTPLVGGKLYTYDAGTSAPRTTWADAGKTAANTNPVILDSNGEATVFWDGAYKVVLKDSSDVTLWTVDGMVSANAYAESADVGTRADIASTAVGKGAALVGSGVIAVNSIGALRSLLKTTPAKAASVAQAGEYRLDASDVTSPDNGSTIIVALDGGRWKLAAGNSEPTLTATEGVAFSGGYRFAYSANLDVPLTPGGVRYWAINGTVRIPSGATLTAGDVTQDHVGISGRAWSASINSRIWGLVGLAHVTSPATSNSTIGQALGSEIDINNSTGYDVANLAGDGDVGGQLVATGGANALKFGWCLSKIAESVGRFFTGLYFRADSLRHDGFGIYFGNVAPSIGIRFGDDYTGGPAMQTNPGQDALYMRTSSGPFARVRAELDRLVMNCGNGGWFMANAANTENLIQLTNAGLLRSKTVARGFGAQAKANAATTIDSAQAAVYTLNDTAATTVTSITGGADVQELTLVAVAGNTTIQHNTGIKLVGAANWAMPAGTTLTLLNVGGTWYETARKGS